MSWVDVWPFLILLVRLYFPFILLLVWLFFPFIDPYSDRESISCPPQNIIHRSKLYDSSIHLIKLYKKGNPG